MDKGLFGDKVAKYRGSNEEVISFDFTNSGFACYIRYGEYECGGIVCQKAS